MKYTIFYTEILARNTYLDPGVDDFLNELQERALNDKVKKYIKSNIRRYLINDFKANKLTKAPVNAPQWLKDSIIKGEEVFTLDLSSKDKQVFNHWIDYLNTLPENKDLSKISIPQLITHVKEWDKTFAKNKADEEDGIKVIKEYPDKYKWVNVFGENSLNREGKLMNHCVGSYYDSVKKNKVQIFSLRDNNNKPHITIEYGLRDKLIEQIKGKNNEPPVEKYMKYLEDFLTKKYIKYNRINEDELRTCNLINLNNKIISILDKDRFFKELLSSNINNLILAETSVSELPKGLKIKGNLTLRRSKIKELPENLEVAGRLDISYTAITELPKGLKVGQSIIIRGNNIDKLPENFQVNGDLDLLRCSIKELPKGLKIKGSLDLYESNVTEIPDDIEISGDLELYKSKVTKLPKNLKVGGLVLQDSKITELPENLEVRGSLLLSKTNVVKISKGLKVGGDLDLGGSNSKIKELPDNITVKRNLILNDSKITRLPKNLKVGENLALYNTKIKELPEDLEVRGEILRN